MAITWPTTLPKTYLQDGYTEGLPDIILQSSMDSGGVFKRRLKATGGYFPLVVSMKCTSIQKATFDTFFKDDLKFGTLACTFPHYVEGETIEVFIMGRSWKPTSGTTWILTLNLMALLI